MSKIEETKKLIEQITRKLQKLFELTSEKEKEMEKETIIRGDRIIWQGKVWGINFECDLTDWMPSDLLFRKLRKIDEWLDDELLKQWRGF